MLSYKHGFHAGNHADVLKHLCWLGVIEHLKQKNKPFTLFDTHAGAGSYSLDDDAAQKTQEFETGIAKLATLEDAAGLLKAYLDVSLPYWNRREYPGSPLIAADVCRNDDMLILMELHPSEFSSLQDTFRSHSHRSNTKLHLRNGLEGLVSMVPPKPNRGAILIDPPYELKSEYTDVVESVSKVLKRWQQAQIVIWYPLLSARAGAKSGASEIMLQKLSKLAGSVFSAELKVASSDQDTGMYGSGVCVINPAWQLDVHLASALKEVCPLLGDNVSASLTWVAKT